MMDAQYKHKMQVRNKNMLLNTITLGALHFLLSQTTKSLIYRFVKS